MLQTCFMWRIVPFFYSVMFLAPQKFWPQLGSRHIKLALPPRISLFSKSILMLLCWYSHINVVVALHHNFVSFRAVHNFFDILLCFFLQLWFNFQTTWIKYIEIPKALLASIIWFSIWYLIVSMSFCSPQQKSLLQPVSDWLILGTRN